MPPEDRGDTPAEMHHLEQAEVDPDLLAPSPRGLQRRTRPGVLIAISVGGVAGTAARYGLSRIMHVAVGSFPWATFTVNVSGSFVLGALITLIIERWPPSRYLRPFAAIGFLGAYTTFSTYMTEAVVLAKDQHGDIAALYVITSLVCGLVAVYVGIVTARLSPLSKERA
ncbi:MAG: fluoride efflux transporter CrcB [Acidimicrobiia bacterium]